VTAADPLPCGRGSLTCSQPDDCRSCYPWEREAAANPMPDPFTPPDPDTEGGEVTMPLLSETGNRQLAPGWFMAFCRDCTLHHPTRSAQKRDEWAQDHADRTGHTVKRLRSADTETDR
jgi:hypothetical protein